MMTKALPGIGSHSARSQTDEWLTPPALIEKLGPFDLDPATPFDMPWATAAERYSVDDDGLSAPWHGRVWLNPPYSHIGPWMARLAEHGDGIALVFARTDTQWWFDSVWGRASGLLFMRGRVTFYRPDGTMGNAGHNSGGPSVLIAYGAKNAVRLRTAGVAGAFIGGSGHLTYER